MFFVCKMAFQSDNLKKIAPMDISHLENFLSNCQIMIEEKLLKCYAEETASRVMVLVMEYCNGCLIDHPSQRQHDCLMIEVDERMCLYFDEAVNSVSEATIVQNFMNSLQDMKPTVNGLERLKYTCQDWRKKLCSRERKKLKTKTRELL